MSGHTGEVFAIEPLSDGNMASASVDTSIIIWNLATASVLHQITNAHNGSVTVLKQLSNGYLASGSNDNNVSLWNLNTYIQVVSPYDAGAEILAMEEVSGMLVVSNMGPPRLFFLNIATLAKIREVSGLSTNLNVLIASADGNFFATGGEVGSYRYWPSTATHFGSRLADLNLTNQSIRSLGRFQNVFFTGDVGKRIDYWDVTNTTTGAVAGNAGVVLLSNAPAPITTLVCLNATCESSFILFLF